MSYRVRRYLFLFVLATTMFAMGWGFHVRSLQPGPPPTSFRWVEIQDKSWARMEYEGKTYFRGHPWKDNLGRWHASWYKEDGEKVGDIFEHHPYKTSGAELERAFTVVYEKWQAENRASYFRGTK